MMEEDDQVRDNSKEVQGVGAGSVPVINDRTR